MGWVLVIDNGRRLRLVYTTSPDYKPLCELNRLASYIPTCLGSKPCLLFVPSFQSTNFCSISWQLFVHRVTTISPTVYFRVVLRIVNVKSFSRQLKRPEALGLHDSVFHLRPFIASLNCGLWQLHLLLFLNFLRLLHPASPPKIRTDPRNAPNRRIL